MEWLGRRLSVGAVRVVLILSVVLALGAGSGLAAPGSPVAGGTRGERALGAPVALIADPEVSRHRTPPPASAVSAFRVQSATIVVNYLPSGSTDPADAFCHSWPTEARSAFNYAAGIWETLISSSVPIEIDACWADLGAGYLGYAMADHRRDFDGAPRPDTWYPLALANALSGIDYDPGDADMHATFNRGLGAAWYFGTDGSTPNGQYDFASVVLHEIAHGLGFAGSMTMSGGSGSWGWWGDPTNYDRFTQDGGGTALIDTWAYPNPSTTLGAALTSNDVWFSGPRANAANGGSRVKLYAPSPWRPGSSYSHLDESFNDTDNALMTYSLRFGESHHSPGPVGLAVLEDVGWATGDPTPVLAHQIFLPLTVRSYTELGPTYTVPATADTTILQGYPDLNAGDVGYMWVGYDTSLDPDGEVVRSLIAFDLAGIPPGTRVAHATLRLYLVDSRPLNDTARMVTAYGISSQWSETDVTWETVLSIGQVYGSTAVGSTAGQWYELDVTDLVRGWADGSLTNHGMMLRGPEHGGADAARRAFSTREGLRAPELVISSRR